MLIPLEKVVGVARILWGAENRDPSGEHRRKQVAVHHHVGADERGALDLVDAADPSKVQHGAHGDANSPDDGDDGGGQQPDE